ncbi:MAG TPA: hypothetical protein VD999_03245 [Vitreimonas sp.]|nr:hypothetical protein [Vitreimonas sp.]
MLRKEDNAASNEDYRNLSYREVLTQYLKQKAKDLLGVSRKDEDQISVLTAADSTEPAPVLTQEQRQQAYQYEWNKTNDVLRGIFPTILNEISSATADDLKALKTALNFDLTRVTTGVEGREITHKVDRPSPGLLPTLIRAYQIDARRSRIEEEAEDRAIKLEMFDNVDDGLDDVCSQIRGAALQKLQELFPESYPGLQDFAGRSNGMLFSNVQRDNSNVPYNIDSQIYDYKSEPMSGSAESDLTLARFYNLLGVGGAEGFVPQVENVQQAEQQILLHLENARVLIGQESDAMLGVAQYNGDYFTASAQEWADKTQYVFTTKESAKTGYMIPDEAPQEMIKSPLFQSLVEAKALYEALKKGGQVTETFQTALSERLRTFQTAVNREFQKRATQQAYQIGQLRAQRPS